MTTVDDALDTITRTIKQNEPSELVKELRALRAEVARLTGKIEALERRPQVVPQPYPVYPPYYSPVVPRPITPWYPWQSPYVFTISGTGIGGTPKRVENFTTYIADSATNVTGFQDARSVVSRLSGDLLDGLHAEVSVQ